MEHSKSFFRAVGALAVPAALQSLLQSSFSIVDQIMIGQLGSVSVAGVGIAGKFTSMFSVLASAVGAVAGIMISQYLGSKNQREIRRSFFGNLLLCLALAGVFTAVCLGLPKQIMGLYIPDGATVAAAAGYLTIVAGTFLPIAGSILLGTLLRCMEKASLPLYASIAAALLNTGLNYALIFGKLGFPAMGANGAAVATLVSQTANFLIMLLLFLPYRNCLAACPAAPRASFNYRQYVRMLLPILVCELMWSLGENVYAAIYGHLGTAASAAMTLINPIVGLTIGALCGLSQAAGVLIGKRLGEGAFDDAYRESKKLILMGFAGAVGLGLLVAAFRGIYVEIYQVEPAVKALTGQILVAYALVVPFKVMNMILGGGIIRSGGQTQYSMAIDLIGTWGFGVPLGLLAGFVLKLSIPYVYFILSLEECVRFAISLVIFRKRLWMRRLSA
ncbi:MAG: MATE family efflux transporter [Clostridiales bacterium]|nr:MATE family efflux transporter [Clostridiales bacterium]MDD7387180.1 MATE family efflux transporter [Bacillota bacterium]